LPTFSHSKIGTFSDCKLQYKFAYVDKVKIPRENTAETFLGSLVHEALERLYRDLQYEKLLTLDELLDHFNAEWGKRWNDSIVLVKKQYTPENYRKMGERYIQDYYARYKPFDQGRVIGIETKSFLSLEEKGNYKYHVRIDRLVDKGEGIYEVHDYKTSRSLPTHEELEQDRQLSMYALWVKQQFYDLKEVRLVWHFLAFDKEMESSRDLEQLEQIRQDTRKKIQEIEEATEFPAHVSRLCDWCLYQELCPMWKHEIELEAKSENEYLNDPGLKLVDEYVRLKEELDSHKRETGEKLEKLKQALVALCEKKQVSAVVGTEKKATVIPYKTWKLPGKNSEERARLLEVLKGLGKSEEVMGIDTHALVKVLQDKKWDDGELGKIAEFAHQEMGYRLNISQRKEE
jgi:putative RecB family exonuclease